LKEEKKKRERKKALTLYVVFSIHRDFEMMIKNAVTSGISLGCDMQSSMVKFEQANNRIKVLTDKAQGLGPSLLKDLFSRQ